MAAEIGLTLVHLLPEIAGTIFEFYHLKHGGGKFGFDNVQVTIINHTDMKLKRTHCGDGECDWSYTDNGRSFYHTEPKEFIDPRSKTDGMASRNAAQKLISSIQYTPEGSSVPILNIWFDNHWGPGQDAKVYSTHEWTAKGYDTQYIEQSSGQNYWFTVVLYKKLSTPGHDFKIPNTHLSESPSVVVHNNKLYCFTRGHDNDRLWYTVYEDLGNNNWQWRKGVDCITNLKNSPSAVVYKSKTFIFHHDARNAGELYFDAIGDNDTREGDKRVSTSDSWMSCSPSAVVYDDKLWVFYQGQGQDGTLRYNVWDGNQNRWEGEQRVPCGISESPSAVEYDNRLFVFHQGQGWAGSLWYSEFKSKRLGGAGVWTGNKRVTDLALTGSPSVVTIKNMIYIFHRESANGRNLWITAYANGRFSKDDIVHQVALSNSPGAVVFHDQIYCFYKGHGQQTELWCKTFAPM